MTGAAGTGETGGAPVGSAGATGAPTTAAPQPAGHAAAVRAAAAGSAPTEKRLGTFPGAGTMTVDRAVPGQVVPPMPAAPMPPLFGDTWPAPVAPPTAAMAVAVALVGLTTATAVPEGRPGLGWLVTALVALAAALAVDWHHRRITLVGVWWTGATVALAAVSAVRAAEWLAVLCLLAALGTATLAVVGRSGRGVWAAAATVALAACRAVPWFGSAATERTDLRRAVRIVLALVVGADLRRAPRLRGSRVREDRREPGPHDRRRRRALGLPPGRRRRRDGRHLLPDQVGPEGAEGSGAAPAARAGVDDPRRAAGGAVRRLPRRHDHHDVRR
jgi:hypothetical protein